MRFFAFLLLSALFPLVSLSRAAAVVTVQLAPNGAGFQLLRDGQPYFVKGGGGSEKALASIKAAGGNSVRLWGDEKLGATLDAAEKLGLTVTAGLWLAQVRQGAKWNDPAFLTRQKEHVRAVVEKYRNHPALLCWALGNEMEDPQGRNTDLWSAINDLAVMVKQLDPQHPTMTVVAEIGGEKVPNFHQLCPAVDILGINSYGGAVSLPERYREAGGTKPYLLTEYGPKGIWETRRNPLGAYAEPSSTEKGETYRQAYGSAVLGSGGLCLGSYAFLWGQKQEVTSTWFSMFLADGSRLAAVDVLHELWTGQPPANRSPGIQSLTLEGGAIGKPGETIRARLAVADPEKDPLKIEWVLQSDPNQFARGGDPETIPPAFPNAIVHGDLTGAEIKLPEAGGLYRLFVFIRDGQGGAATANVSLKVDATTGVEAPRGQLPFSIYANGESTHYQPTGWMGDTKSIKLDPACTERPHAGTSCLKCEFTATKGWGGVVWQDPGGDWGKRSGGFDLTGAKRLTFWARGAEDGEIVTFEFGIIKNKKFADTAQGSLPKVALTKEWKQYEIPLAPGADLSRIKTGFVWSVASQGQPVAFYLDDIQWQ